MDREESRAFLCVISNSYNGCYWGWAVADGDAQG